MRVFLRRLLLFRRRIDGCRKCMCLHGLGLWVPVFRRKKELFKIKLRFLCNSRRGHFYMHMYIMWVPKTLNIPLISDFTWQILTLFSDFYKINDPFHWQWTESPPLIVCSCWQTERASSTWTLYFQTHWLFCWQQLKNRFKLIKFYLNQNCFFFHKYTSN